MKLFIIGNGFDLAHKIESTYWHFGKYLEKNNPDFYYDLMAAINNDQGIWSDFEGNLPECGSEMESCGLQVAQERLDELDYDPMSDEGMRQWVNEKLAFIDQLPDVLRSWIESVDIVKPQAYIPHLLNKNDLYLSFNYTNTLEQVYSIPSKNILHIHGNVANYNETLIMGHRSLLQMQCAERDYNRAVSEFADCASAVYECVLKFLEKTFKYTDDIIADHIDFFSRLDDVHEIMIIGSSLSSIDRPYFEYINKLGVFDWTVVYYDPDIQTGEKEKNKAKAFFQSLGTPNDKYHLVPSSQILKTQQENRQ